MVQRPEDILQPGWHREYKVIPVNGYTQQGETTDAHRTRGERTPPGVPEAAAHTMGRGNHLSSGAK